MFGLEPWHIILLLAVLLVIFGPKRLPEIGKNLGESIREFRKATTEFGDSVKAGAAAPPTAPPIVSPTAPQPTAPIAVVPPISSGPAAGQETQPAASPTTQEPPAPPPATAG
jgi:sec-independent protein translocase protein TatA